MKYDAVAHDSLEGAGYRGGAPLAAIRPMEKIALTPEYTSHRAAKASGEDVEVQTGDPAFDAAVYVDTMAPAHVVQRILGPDFRQAVLELFALEFNKDRHRRLQRRGHGGPRDVPDAGRAGRACRRAADAFARLAGSLPRVGKAPGRYPRHPLRTWTARLVLAVLVSAMGALPLYCQSNSRCADDVTSTAPSGVPCAGPFIPGMGLPAVAAVVAGVLAARYARRYRGRSDSSSWASTFIGTLVALVFVVVSTVVGIVVAYSGSVR